MPSETRRERKVVTVVFCDLGGFTSRAEKLAMRRRSRRAAYSGATAATGRRPESKVELQKALTFHRSVGATLFVKHGEQLLAKST